jgi:threonine synthase
MRYVSTEGRAPAVSLEQALFAGPAPDGGLYVPETLPELDPPQGTTLAETSLAIAERLFGEDLGGTDLEAMVREALNFEIPLVPVNDERYCLELFHGPTLAFKDVGARFMARLIVHYLSRRDQEATVLVATSGDTGSAVAHAYYRQPGIRVVVLFPRDKVSPLQQKLFTTLQENVYAVSVDGNFDDCQRLAKSAFADEELTERRPLVSANSINVGRLLPQTFYYFHLYAQLPEEARGALLVSVPSGNFGNLTAGLLAKRMGLPVERFVAATNVNDVVPEYLASGIFRPRASIQTITSAMDVGNPSNFARIQWLYGHSRHALKKDLIGSAHTDDDTRAAIRKVYEGYEYVLDPHGAVGYLGALDGQAEEGPETSAVFLGTAHPAKFKETVEAVIGKSIPLPEALQSVSDKPERIEKLGVDYPALKNYLIS